MKYWALNFLSLTSKFILCCLLSYGVRAPCKYFSETSWHGVKLFQQRTVEEKDYFLVLVFFIPQAPLLIQVLQLSLLQSRWLLQWPDLEVCGDQ